MAEAARLRGGHDDDDDDDCVGGSDDGLPRTRLLTHTWQLLLGAGACTHAQKCETNKTTQTH